ncbi:MAG: peptidoglycan DD-metalloendopeptidase family protein [Porphyromonas sp.]|nr:peptidoglycan DD-metalloendopeptidase family protein [Porphyromonas sp.]
MTSRIITFCFFVLLGGVASAQVPNYRVPTKQKTELDSETAPPTEKDCGISEVATLLADNDGFLKNNKKLSEYTKSINKTMGYNVVTEEDLQYPSIDLYGEASWHSKAVNPFIGTIKAEVPDSFVVDLSQFVYPLDEIKRVTSRYGYRRRFRRMHYGIDISLTVGDTVRAAFDGKVRMVDYDRRGYGRYVVIRHTNGLETVYGHNSKLLVEENQVVRAGDPIALGGNTGRSTGPHLHFETRYLGQALNPDHLINFSNGIPKTNEYLCLANGYKGGTGVGAKAGHSGKAGEVQMYRIKKGDTLSAIAKRHHTTVSQLCKLNNMSSRTTLRVGRSIRVS